MQPSLANNWLEFIKKKVFSNTSEQEAKRKQGCPKNELDATIL
jgi:hypothetical protein